MRKLKFKSEICMVCPLLAANANSLAGKLVARYTVTCFDVIESVFSQNTTEPRLALPVHATRRSDPGVLEVSLKYDELTSGLVARNAAPLQVSVPSFSIERSAKEMRRFARVMGWPYIFLRKVSEMLSWSNPIETVGCIILIVLFCTIPSWSERPLVVVPAILLIYLGINYRKRMDGRFIASFITQSGHGAKHNRHASLKVCVVKAKNVFDYNEPREVIDERFVISQSRSARSGNSNETTTTDIRPVFNIKLMNLAKMEQSDVGHSAPLDRSTRNPDWAFRAANLFKPAHGSTLVSWRAGLSEHHHTSASEDKVRFNLKNHQAFLCAIEKKPDESVLIVRIHRVRLERSIEKADDYRVRLGPRDGAETMFKTSKEVADDELVFEEDIACLIDPDDVLVIAFGRSSDFSELGSCQLDDAFRQPQRTLVSIALTSAHWHLEGEERLADTLGLQRSSSLSGSRVTNGGIQVAPTVIGFIDVEFFHFGDSTSGMIASMQSRSFLSDGLAAFDEHDEMTNGTELFVDEMTDGLQDVDDFARLTIGATKEREVAIPKKDFEQASKASIQTWKRQPLVVAIELHDRNRKGPFLGRALLPLSRLVTDMDSLEQPTFHEWLKLEPRYDGSSKDRQFCNAYNGQGMIFVSAQVVLPIPIDDAVLKDEQDAKRAKFPHEKFAALARQADRVYRDARAFNDRMERIKNTFNWAVASRTRLVLNITVFLLMLFALVPSRFIILFVGLYLFTEKFRPHGIVIIAINHLFSLAPTDEDFSKVVSREIFGRVRHNRSSRSLTAGESSEEEGQNSTSEDEEELGEEEADSSHSIKHEIGGKLSTAKRALRQVQRVFPRLLRRDKKPSADVETLGTTETARSFFERRLGSIAQGYLRVLERHLRGMWFRRYFFTYDGFVMQYWARKKDFLNRRPSVGRIESVVSCEPVLPNTKAALVAAENDALKVECMFLLEQEAQTHFGASTHGVGSTLGSIVRHDVLGGKTLFAANSSAGREVWIRAFHRRTEDLTAFDEDDEDVM